MGERVKSMQITWEWDWTSIQITCRLSSVTLSIPNIKLLSWIFEYHHLFSYNCSAQEPSLPNLIVQRGIPSCVTCEAKGFHTYLRVPCTNVGSIATLCSEWSDMCYKRRVVLGWGGGTSTNQMCIRIHAETYPKHGNFFVGTILRGLNFCGD